MTKVLQKMTEKSAMGMLDRYKKKGGFIQLLNLLETSSKLKQEQFLNLIQQENTHWEEALKKRILNIEKIVSWDKESLSEIITRIQPLTLAVALRHFTEDKRDAILNVLTQSDKRKIQNLVSETNPNAAEVATCVSKIVTEVRTLIQQGIIKLEKIDPEIAIPENIEELLNQKGQLNFIEYDAKTDSKTDTSDSSGESSLDFSGFDKKKKPIDEKSDGSKDELEFLKRKVNTLVQENSHLKQEVSVLRNKLDQIKKIA